MVEQVSHEPHDLLDACKELRDACAAAMRVIAFYGTEDAQTAWHLELHRLGIADGFGVRAQAAIAKAEGR